MTWQELENETLENLVELLQLKGDSESDEWANAAFINITFRFRKDLLEKCTRMCLKSGLTETDAEEVTNRTFESLFKYCKFRVSECKTEDVEKCFRYYLYSIARNEFADYVKPDDSPYTGEEKVIISLIDPNVDYTPEKLSQLKEVEAQLDKAFSTLTPKHKIIYLTYQYHEHEGKNIPRQLAKELRDVVKLSQSSIRVYKKQAFDLMKSLGYGS
ncbi:sigma-70 family RNA polymerase sigma factor [Niabella sp.]|uniref:sigma-70 family RNA polymerase sigma factor n=1 Tax=Niabella sp. TaxID=1962976 RepID=UPI00261D68C2|nr:sigma-70 family RNA polymerase sigma factor [Niabella sp.]